jgi:MFS family permease
VTSGSPPASRPAAPGGRPGLPSLYLAFFLSGAAALVYQVVWQRALLTIYGVNVESVALVVAAFLVGLGTGSLLGGLLSRRPGLSPLRTVGLFELAIGVYGVASLALFRALGEMTAGRSGLATFLAAFGLVLLPTAGMGATLPLLSAYIVNRLRNVGRSVGALYFVNTLGSAVSAGATALYLLGPLGQQRTLFVAAGLNGAVALLMLRASSRDRRQ